MFLFRLILVHQFLLLKRTQKNLNLMLITVNPSPQANYNNRTKIINIQIPN